MKNNDLYITVISASLLVLIIVFSGCGNRSTKYLDPSSQGSFSPYPDDNSTNNSVRQTLTWEYKSIADSYNYRYSICFGKDSSPELVSINQEEIYFLPPDMLDYETTYYWKVIAHGSDGEIVESPVWSFKTERTNIIEPVRIYETPGYAWDVYVEGDLAYVADDLAGLQIIDLNLPCDDAIIANYHSFGSAEHIAYKDGFVYLYCYTYEEPCRGKGGRVEVIDVSDPYNLFVVDSIFTFLNLHDLVINENYLLAPNELPNRVYDISNPYDIQEIPCDLIPPNGTIVIRDNYLYWGNTFYAPADDNYWDNMIYDITDFFNPVLIRQDSLPISVSDFDVAYGYVYGINGRNRGGGNSIIAVSLSDSSNVCATTLCRLRSYYLTGMFIIPGYAIYASCHDKGIMLLQVEP